MRFGAIFLFIPLLLFGGNKEKVKEIDNKLNTAQKEHSALTQQTQSILKELQRIDREITKSKNKIIKLKAEGKKLEDEIKELSITTDEKQDQLSKKDTSIKGKMVMLYEDKVVNPAPMGITSTSDSMLDTEITDLYINEILKNDNDTRYELTNIIDTLCIQSEAAKLKFQELTKTRAKLETEYSKILKQRKNKSTILKKVKNQTAEKSRLIKELKTARANLEALIAKAASQKSKLQTFAGIIWPLKGKIVSKFGTVIDQQVGTQLLNKGIDIAAPYGTNVIASSDGKVVYEDAFLGYGKMILIDHENGFCTLYAHLSETLVTKGDKVTKSEVIGKVGSSGLIEDPTLHFEIRKSGEAVDPLKILP